MRNFFNDFKEFQRIYYVEIQLLLFFTVSFYILYSLNCNFARCYFSQKKLITFLNLCRSNIISNQENFAFLVNDSFFSISSELNTQRIKIYILISIVIFLSVFVILPLISKSLEEVDSDSVTFNSESSATDLKELLDSDIESLSSTIVPEDILENPLLETDFNLENQVLNILENHTSDLELDTSSSEVLGEGKWNFLFY